MFGLRVVQAEFGDCLILEYGTNQKRYMLIDGGPPLIYERHLKKELKKIAAGGGKLERVILSHVDGDHIVGLIDFFADLRDTDPGFIGVDGIWMNSFSGSAEIAGLEPQLRAVAGMSPAAMAAGAEVQTIGEGNDLTVLATQLTFAMNDGFPDNLVLVDTAPAPMAFDNIELRVVGPTKANLDALRDEWEAWLEKETDALNSADPFVMANADKSIPNKSSIMLHVTDGSKTMLLTGDGRSDHLLAGLGDAGLLQNGKMHVDLFKLAHHGSNRNVTKTFFKNVTADTYVASANGKDDNPDLSTLIWIVEAAQAAGRQIDIFVTNETLSTKKLLENYDPQEFGYTLKVLPKSKSSELIEP